MNEYVMVNMVGNSHPLDIFPIGRSGVDAEGAVYLDCSVPAEGVVRVSRCARSGDAQGIGVCFKDVVPDDRSASDDVASELVGDEPGVPQGKCAVLDP